MPDWFAALFMLCILSASMSTLSSQFHTMGASVGSDIYGTYKPRSRNKLTNVIRLGVLFSILVSYIICYMLPHDIIARGTSIFMGICAAAFLPPISVLYIGRKLLSRVSWQVFGSEQSLACLPLYFFIRKNLQH